MAKKMRIELPTATTLSSKEKLLKAALETFSQHGYHGTTTKMISVAAGVNEALIMRHFESKSGLFFEVVRQNLIHEPESLPYPPQESLAKELLCFADFIYERDAKQTPFLKMLIGQCLQDDDFAQKMRTQIAHPNSMLLQARLKMLQQKKKMPAQTDFFLVQQAIKNQIFSALFFSCIAGLYDKKMAQSILHMALTHFAKGLEKG